MLSIPQTVVAHLLFYATFLAGAPSSHARLSRRDDAFRVTYPVSGDTLTIPDSSLDDIQYEIKWTVPEDLRERPVIISLVSGPPINLTTVEAFSSDANNNGSYTWYPSPYTDAWSACNYSIYIKAWNTFTYSDYFTIINPDDGGIDVDSTCPGDTGRMAPDVSNYEVGSGTASDASEASSSGDSDSNDRSGGVTTTTLAIAVVIPIVVLLIIFGLVLFFGTRRGWFIKKSDRNILRSAESRWDNPGDQTITYEKTAELDGKHEPHRIDGREVYQLQGDEERRA